MANITSAIKDTISISMFNVALQEKFLKKSSRAVQRL